MLTMGPGLVALALLVGQPAPASTPPVPSPAAPTLVAAVPAPPTPPPTQPSDPAPPPKPPHLAIVPTRVHRGPNLRRYVRRFLERPLRKTAKIIPFGKLRRAARRAHVRPRALGTPTGAKAAGAKAGATHVLIVQGIRERKKVGRRRRNVFYANLILVNVDTGETVFTKRYALKGRRMTRGIGEQMVTDLKDALQPPPPPPAPEPVAAATPPPAPTPPPPPAAPSATPPPAPAAAGGATATAAATANGSAAGGATTSESATAAKTGEATGSGAEASAGETGNGAAGATTPPESSKSKGETVASATSDETSLQATIPAPTGGGYARPGFHVWIGALAVQRNGVLSAKGGSKPPCYCGRNGDSNPFFPAGYIGVELYPLAIGGTGAWYEGFGLHGEGYFTEVKTEIDPATKQTVPSSVIGARGGLTYRLVFWDGKKAPDFKLNLGYGYFGFPLSQGAFPGVKYSGPYVGGYFAIPLGTAYVSLLLGGSYSFMVQTTGKTKRLGDHEKSGMSFRGEGGVRLSFAPFEVNLVVRYDQYSAKFKGTTSLDAPVQFDNVTLTDKLLGGYLSAGVAF